MGLVAVSIGAVIAANSLYFQPQAEKRAVNRALATEPVLDAAFSEVLSGPDRFIGEVVRLHGPVDHAYLIGSGLDDPTGTTFYDPDPAVLDLVDFVGYWSGFHLDEYGPGGPPFGRSQLDLFFHQPEPFGIEKGSVSVTVTCRVMGVESTGMFESKVVADVCRDAVFTRE